MLPKLLTSIVKEKGIAKIITDYYIQMTEFEDLQEELRHYYDTDNMMAYICLIREIPETILNENPNYINWHLILQHKRCSLQFLDKHFNTIRKNDLAHYIFPYQQLSINFLNKHKDKYTHKEWYFISLCQKITPEFVEENKKHIVFYALSNNQKIN